MIRSKVRLNSKEVKEEVIKILEDGGKQKQDITKLIQECFFVPDRRIDYAIRSLANNGHLGKKDNLLDMRIKIYYLTNKGRHFYERVLL